MSVGCRYHPQLQGHTQLPGSCVLIIYFKTKHGTREVFDMMQHAQCSDCECPAC